MPVWLSLFVAVLGTVGFFAGLYAVIIGLVEAKKAKGRPRLGIGIGSRAGTFTYWVKWEPETFAVQIYRLRVSLYNPNGDPQESVFTISHDSPIKAPFQQEVEFPPAFQSVLTKQSPDREALITFDFRTLEEHTLAANLKLSKVRKISNGEGPRPPGLNALAPAKADHPTVMTLDYSELVQRRKKLKDLEAAAKAKAAKAPPKPATAPAPAATAVAAAKPAPPPPAPAAPVATPAPAAKPAPAPAATAKPPPAKGDVPSIKDVIAKANAQAKETGE